MPTNPNDPIFWTMLEAIGTCLAAGIAIFGLFYFEIFRPSLNNPSLEILFKNENPYTSITTGLILAGKPPDYLTSIARFIRIGVENKSRTHAVGVRVKLSWIADEYQGKFTNFIPYDLLWVDTKNTRKEVLGFREEAFAELFINVQLDHEVWWLQPYDIRHASGFGNIAGLPTTPEPPYRVFIELTAYAENLPNPVSKVFQVDYDDAKKIGVFSMKETRVKITDNAKRNAQVEYSSVK